MAQLKSIGAYDNSTIVIKGDHGEPVEYNDPRTYEGFTVRGHRLWGFGRYAPFLAIKQRGVSRQEVGFDDRHVSTADLARTLCLEQIGDRIDCSVYPGVDLLGAEPVPADARLFVYIVENADSSFPIGSLEAIEVPRGPEFFSALNDYLTDELVPERAACTPQATTGGTPYNTGLTDGKSWVTWWNGDTAYLKVAGPACLSRVLVLTFAPQSPAAAPADLAVSVDGTDVEFQPTQGQGGLELRLALDPGEWNEPVAVEVEGLSVDHYRLAGFRFEETR